MTIRANRRRVLRNSLLPLVAVSAGCSAILGGAVDVRIDNNTARTIVNTTSVARQNSGKTLFEEEFELEPNESRTFENAVSIPDRGARLVVSTTIEGERFERTFSVSRGTDVRYFSIDILEDDASITMGRA